jgi:uncharacterized membrane protein YhaH (DUF805 family)
MNGVTMTHPVFQTRSAFFAHGLITHDSQADPRLTRLILFARGIRFSTNHNGLRSCWPAFAAMKHLFTTNGRVARITYWNFFAFFILFSLVFGMLEEAGMISESMKPVLGLAMLPIMVVGIIIHIKRWHDRDKSGWWIFINLIPVVGGLWSLIECGFLKGTAGSNRFGPDPLAAKPPTLPH